MSRTELPPVGSKTGILAPSDIFAMDLMLECADALLCPLWDHEERDDHRIQISAVLASGQLPDHLYDLLTRADGAFEAHSRMRMIDFISSSRTGDQMLAQELIAQVPLSLQYLYHGTTFAKLAAIADEGLVSGRPSNWKGLVDEEHLNGAVFFDQTWRGAMDWAMVASSRLKGPKLSKNRQPVILRIRRGANSVEPDQKATKPGCFLVRGNVSALGAGVLVGEQRGIPEWCPLDKVVEKA